MAGSDQVSGWHRMAWVTVLALQGSVPAVVIVSQEGRPGQWRALP